MAWYSAEEVWFRGRMVNVMFRYGVFMSASVVRGKPLHFSSLPASGRQKKEGVRNTRRLLRVLRRKGIVGQGGNDLTYDPFAGVEDY